jgi:hypothetical protein
MTPAPPKVSPTATQWLVSGQATSFIMRTPAGIGLWTLDQDTLTLGTGPVDIGAVPDACAVGCTEVGSTPDGGVAPTALGAVAAIPDRKRRSSEDRVETIEEAAPGDRVHVYRNERAGPDWGQPDGIPLPAPQQRQRPTFKWARGTFAQRTGA